MPVYPFIESYEYLKQQIKQFELSYQIELQNSILDLRQNKFKSRFKDSYTGNIYESKGSGSFKVLEYFNYDRILIEFINTGYKMLARANNINKGEVKDPYSISVLGIGYLGLGPYGINDTSFNKMIYSRWRGIIERCYIFKEGNKTMHPEWFNFQYFSAWFYSEFYTVPNCTMYDMCIDKDILIPKNQEYSPYKCLIIPNFINNKIQLKDFDRVMIDKLESGELNQNEIDRVIHHKKYREVIVHRMAEEYKSVLPSHVYKALSNYQMF